LVSGCGGRHHPRAGVVPVGIAGCDSLVAPAGVRRPERRYLPLLVSGQPLPRIPAACVSDVGAFDMVGNLLEWVAEWVDPANVCVENGLVGVDEQCIGGPGGTGVPAAITRGGHFRFRTKAGAYAVAASIGPLSIATFDFTGFRCVRAVP
jgi:hypothetical protein